MTEPLNGAQPQPEPPTLSELRVQAAIAMYVEELRKSVTTPSPQGPIVSVDLMQMLVQSRLQSMQLQLVLACLAEAGLNGDGFNQRLGAMIEGEAAALKKASDKPRILVPH